MRLPFYQSLLGALATAPFILAAFSANAQPPYGFPDSIRDSGKFVTVTRGLASLGDVGPGQDTFNLELAIPASLAQFRLWIYDGELSNPVPNPNGDDNRKWDRLPAGTPDQIVFKLFKDPELRGSTDPADLIQTWSSSDMPNDDWCKLQSNGTCGDPNPLLDRVDDACPNFPDGNCYYHLVADWLNPVNTDEQNAFKVAADGPAFLLAGSTIGFEGFGCNPQATISSCPDDNNPSLPGYDGEFTFNFLVPETPAFIELYDGDFDRAGDITNADDTDDPNSPNCDPFDPAPPNRNQNCTIAVQDTAGYNPAFVTAPGAPGEVLFPPFQISPDTLPQDQNTGDPRDDQLTDFFVFPPPIFYTVDAPAGACPPGSGWPVTNNNPSGNQEWERFTVGRPGESLDSDLDRDCLPAGLYNWNIQGVDYKNTLFVYSLYNLYPDTGCDLTLTKTCTSTANPLPSLSCEATLGEVVDYQYTVKNIGTTPFNNVCIIDDPLGDVGCLTEILGSGASATLTKSAEALTDVTNIATVSAEIPGPTPIQCTATASARVTIGGGGGEGCTPGYWKQKHHFDSWVTYQPDDLFSAVFGVAYDNDPEEETLLDALKAGGGGYKAMGRHAVAALLNAASSPVDYLYTESTIISLVQQAYATGNFERIKNLFEYQNEQGCPLN